MSKLNQTVLEEKRRGGRDGFSGIVQLGTWYRVPSVCATVWVLNGLSNANTLYASHKLDYLI